LRFRFAHYGEADGITQIAPAAGEPTPRRTMAGWLWILLIVLLIVLLLGGFGYSRR